MNKIKYISGLLLMTLGLGFTACSDEDYSESTTPVIQSIQTGDAEVTAVSAVANGSLQGLDGQSAAAYQVGVYYSLTNNPKQGGTKVVGTLTDKKISASISDLTTNKTYYYCSYVTLQGKVTYYGDVKQFTTIDAKVTATGASSITGAKADLGINVTGADNAPVTVSYGARVGSTDDVEALKECLDVESGTLSANDVKSNIKGLLPNKTYYYLPYIALGDGKMYATEAKSFTTNDVQFEYVDLGLSVKWATFNLGAEAVNEVGGLFGYGDATGTNTSTALDGYISGNDIYGSSNDIVAACNKGRMPSIDNVKELVNACSFEMVNEGGVQCAKFTAKNGKSILLPVNGYRDGETMNYQDMAGYYWTGCQAEGSGYAQSMVFNSFAAGSDANIVTNALSVRPVMKSSKALDKALLCKTWHLDINADGESFVFGGPLGYYGMDDSWTTITDGDKVAGDSWNWTPEWKNNTWVCKAMDCGTMTFTADGKVLVVDKVNNASYEGTYVVNENLKTITLTGAKILHTDKCDPIVTNWSTDLKILSLTDEGLQIAAVRDNSPGEGKCLLAQNFITDEIVQLHIKPVYNVNMCLYDGSNDNWTNYTLSTNLEEGKQYTVEATNIKRNAGQVYIIDIPDFSTKNPNAVIRLDKIEIDGKEVSFDPNKIHYGNLEGKGTYRIELYNVWGSGTNDDSPFGGGTSGESALAITSSIKATFTVVSLDLQMQAELSAADNNYSSGWPDAKVSMSLSKITLPHTYTMKFEGSRPNGMVDVIDIKDIMSKFPNMKCTLKEVKVDDTVLSFDASKILYGNLEGKGTYRIEIYNANGNSVNDPAFSGITTDKYIPTLGFTSSFEVTFTLDKLF